MTDRPTDRQKPISRRDLLAYTKRIAAAGAASTLVSQLATAQLADSGANSRVGVAMIGCGRRGQQLLSLLLERNDISIAAVCDVDKQAAGRAADRIVRAGKSKPTVVADFLHILEQKEVLAVIIATPDHWHVSPLLHACAAGRDAYLETPIAHNIVEGLAMVRAVRKYRRVVQVGLQLRAALWIEKASQEIRSQSIGGVAQTRSWSFCQASPVPKQPDSDPPSNLDYDRWLGPAPKRAYNGARVGPNASNWWDYGSGTLGLWNPHLQDVVHRAMRINVPTSVTAVGGNMGLGDFRDTPDTLEVVCEYQNAHGSFIHVHSLRMSNAHAVWGLHPEMPMRIPAKGHPDTGVQFHGEQATLSTGKHGTSLLMNNEQTSNVIGAPPALNDRTDIDEYLTRIHLDEFIHCVRTRGEPRAPIEVGHFAALPCHLANIAYRLGRKIYYDHQQPACFLDADHTQADPTANRLLTRDYRNGYIPPSV